MDAKHVATLTCELADRLIDNLLDEMRALPVTEPLAEAITAAALVRLAAYYGHKLTGQLAYAAYADVFRRQMLDLKPIAASPGMKRRTHGS